MFLALHDTLPMRRLRDATVTHVLIGLSFVIYLIFQSGWLVKLEPEFTAGFGMIPKLLTGAASLPPDIFQAPAYLTPLTYMFLHGSWMHLIPNLLFLFVLGNNIEDAMGHIRFLVFYLLVGVLSALLYMLINRASESPLIGASGAISGVIAAYLMLHPQAKIFGLLFGVLPMNLRAYVALGLWVVFQIGQAVLDPEKASGFVVHLSGLVVGACLVPLFKSRDVHLFASQAEDEVN